jgi:hypothetical protein
MHITSHLTSISLSPCFLSIICAFSAEKCDPDDPTNWWNQPPVEVYPYSGGFQAEDAAAAAPASESGSSGTVAMKVTEDSFGTNNQVSME